MFSPQSSYLSEEWDYDSEAPRSQIQATVEPPRRVHRDNTIFKLKEDILDYFQQRDKKFLLKQNIDELVKMVDSCPEGEIPTSDDLQKFSDFINLDFRSDKDDPNTKPISPVLDYHRNVKKLVPKSFHPRAYELIQHIERKNKQDLKDRGYYGPSPKNFRLE